ncbi:hypothetical protein DPMN_003979 [Dreissena polymorpha]|uniref:Uncharacterized protein n=1 Tax=Dreissena polymorpha TaxID=45954 RepID=A0A9D4RVG8_DREPO|nr:hypothetical protein DPMN_003979 [Dreissena polymorpha]
MSIVCQKLQESSSAVYIFRVNVLLVRYSDFATHRDRHLIHCSCVFLLHRQYSSVHRCQEVDCHMTCYGTADPAPDTWQSSSTSHSTWTNHQQL